MLYPAFLCAVMSLSHNRLRVWDRLYLEAVPISENLGRSIMCNYLE